MRNDSLRLETSSSPGRRLNTAGLCALSRRLMALERARALGRKPLDLRGWALEKEAQAWVERRASGVDPASIPALG